MATRKKLIEASTAVFSRQGFDGTSLSSIAEEAGVTQPTLNYHFGTKDQLYREVIEDCGERWVAAINVGDDLRDLSRPDALKVMLRGLGRIIAGQKVETRLIMQASMHPDFEAEVGKALRPGVDALTAILSELMDSGYLRRVPPYVIISMFIDILTTTAGMEHVKSAVYDEDFSDPAVIDAQVGHLIDIVLNGTLSHPSHDG